MRAPWKAQEQITTELTGQKNGARPSRRDFLLYLGPALMVSLAYMDPGNYGTDLAAGAGVENGVTWGGLAFLREGCPPHYLFRGPCIASWHSSPRTCNQVSCAQSRGVPATSSSSRR